MYVSLKPECRSWNNFTVKSPGQMYNLLMFRKFLFSHRNLSSSFPFRHDQLNDCNDVIILPLINLVYASLWSFICIWLNAPWLCDCFNQISKPLNIVTVWFCKLWSFILRDPSLGENTNIFLKWFCCYLGVYLLQPGYVLSANTWKAMHGCNTFNINP